jgi:Ca2+-binding RTX toxin-like protein
MPSRRTDELFAPLEPRHLLAGVTLLIHGNSGNITGWVAKAADYIKQRAGGGSAVSTAVLTIGKNASNKLAVLGYATESGSPAITAATQGELILKVDWSAVASAAASTVQVGNLVADFLLTDPGNGLPLAQLPIHLVGHSRGASMDVAIAQALGKRGVWVDQMTLLDAHPVDGVNDFANGNYGDVAMTTPSNVYFADGYWRTDGNTQNFDFDGEPTPGAYNLNLQDSVQQSFFVSAHSAVTAWYNGTINTSATAGGEQPIQSGWYSGTATKPARDQTGFAYSRLGGLTQPESGVGTNFGGTGARTSPGKASGSQSPNALAVQVNTATFSTGRDLTVSALTGDADSSATVQFFVDRDRNPYNGNSALTLAGVATNGATKRVRQTFTTVDLTPGSYYLGVAVTDGSRTRYAYRQAAVTAQSPNDSELPARVESGRLVIDGTAGNDLVGVSFRNGRYYVQRNDFTQNVSGSGVSRIDIDLGDGDDQLYPNANVTTPLYAFGGDGNDLVYGGGGNDTLTAGAGKNTLYGGAGDDRLNGSGGRDLIFGESGNDRLYGNGGSDTLDGGGNVDRLFAGDGADVLFGGGSNDKLYAEAGDDTLYGQAGSDLVDGGIGTDSAENDPNDTRISIEVLL